MVFDKSTTARIVQLAITRTSIDFIYGLGETNTWSYSTSPVYV